MREWNESLNKNNIIEFIDEYAPMAYKAAYRVLGDTTRTENVLVESFVETYHFRNNDDDGSALFTFGDILESKVQSVSSKYPIPDSVKISPRTLDDFTKTTIFSEVEKRINSLSFRVMDILIFSDRSVKKGKSSSYFSRLIASAVDSGVNLLLIIQMIVVVLLLLLLTYFGAMTVFGIENVIIQNPFRDAQRNYLYVGEAIRYMPVDIIHSIEDDYDSGEDISGEDGASLEDIYLSDSDSSEVESSNTDVSETESSEPSLSATRG